MKNYYIYGIIATIILGLLEPFLALAGLFFIVGVFIADKIVPVLANSIIELLCVFSQSIVQNIRHYLDDESNIIFIITRIILVLAFINIVTGTYKLLVWATNKL